MFFLSIQFLNHILQIFFSLWLARIRTVFFFIFVRSDNNKTTTTKEAKKNIYQPQKQKWDRLGIHHQISNTQTNKPKMGKFFSSQMCVHTIIMWCILYYIFFVSSVCTALSRCGKNYNNIRQSKVWSVDGSTEILFVVSANFHLNYKVVIGEASCCYCYLLIFRSLVGRGGATFWRFIKNAYDPSVTSNNMRPRHKTLWIVGVFSSFPKKITAKPIKWNYCERAKDAFFTLHALRH